MELSEWLIDQLKLVPDFENRCHEIEDLEEALSKPLVKLQGPVAYGIVLSVAARPNQTGTTLTHQTATTTFSVVLAIPNTTNPLGSLGKGTKAQVEKLRRKVLGVVHGKTPVVGTPVDQSFEPSQYVRGRLVRAQDRVLWWQDEFSTQHYMRSIE